MRVLCANSVQNQPKAANSKGECAVFSRQYFPALVRSPAFPRATNQKVGSSNLSGRAIPSNIYRRNLRVHLGCVGCNWFRDHRWIEPESRLFGGEATVLDIFPDLRITVCDAPVGMTNPKANEVFRNAQLT